MSTAVTNAAAQYACTLPKQNDERTEVDCKSVLISIRAGGGTRSVTVVLFSGIESSVFNSQDQEIAF